MELGNNRDLSGETINIACGSVVYQRKDDKVILVTATPSALKMVGHEGKEIEELRETGRGKDAELIRGVLNNRSVSAAEELARNIDIVEIPEEEKPLIQSGKKSSYS